jgi:signal transduction histidine kinase
MAAATSPYTNFVRRFSNLIGRFGEANLALGRGETEVRLPVKGRDGLGELGEKLNAMAMNLQGTITNRERSKQLTTLGKIIASVSHELRNPLGTIRTSMFSIRERTRTRTWESKKPWIALAGACSDTPPSLRIYWNSPDP